MICTDYSAINRPTNEDFVLINVKIKPEHRKAFRQKCLELDLIGSDLVRDFIAEFISK